MAVSKQHVGHPNRQTDGRTQGWSQRSQGRITFTAGMETKNHATNTNSAHNNNLTFLGISASNKQR